MSEALRLAAECAKEFEGLSLDPYRDPVGYPTIGYGHLLSRNTHIPLTQWQSISIDAAHSLLEDDMMTAVGAVARLINVPLTAGQEAALIDFCFNCGSGNLQVSTLRRVVNRQEYDAAPTQLMRWVYARGMKLPGLVRRRQAECELWQR